MLYIVNNTNKSECNINLIGEKNMSKEVPKYRKIDEHSFNAIKTLINTGLSGREIQRAMNISQTTFWRIKTSETLEQYRQVVNEKNYPQKHLSEKDDGQRITDMISETTITPIGVNFTEAQAENIVEVLNKILEKLSIIADNTKPKGLFH